MFNEDLIRKYNEAHEQYPWLLKRTILLAPIGSLAYGTYIEGISDKDFRGICIPPNEYIIGLNSFSEYNNTSRKNVKIPIRM